MKKGGNKVTKEKVVYVCVLISLCIHWYAQGTEQILLTVGGTINLSVRLAPFACSNTRVVLLEQPNK